MRTCPDCGQRRCGDGNILFACARPDPDSAQKDAEGIQARAKAEAEATRLKGESEGVAEKAHGEGFMHDTAMLLGALGWDQYRGQVEVVTPYFPSSGTGQINAIFPVHSLG